MRKIILLTIFILSIKSFGQKEPNLNKYKTQELKLQTWAEYCETLLKNENFQLLRKKAKNGLLLAKNNDFEYISLFNFYIGSSFDYQKEIDSAIYYFEKSHLNLKKSNNKKNSTRLLYELLYAYKTTGFIKKREQIIIDYQKIIDTTKSKNQKFLLQENLADYYLSIGEYETSLKYLLNGIQTRKKALNKKSSKQDSIDIGVKLVNVAELFLGIDKTNEGFESIKEAQLYIKNYKTGNAFIHKLLIAIYINKNDIVKAKKEHSNLEKLLKTGAENKAWDAYMAGSLTIADDYLTKKNDYKTALKYISIARNLAPKYANKYMLGSIDYMSGEAYLALKDYEKALIYLKKAEPIAKEEDPQAYGWVQNALSKSYAALGNWELAYKHKNEYSVVSDTLHNELAKKNLSEMEAKYQNNVKKQDIQNKNLQIVSAKKQKYYFIAGLFLLAIIGSLLFYQSRNRKKNNEKLQILNENLDLKNTELDEANKAKTRFFSILNHDLRGPVANLVFFLQLQKESPEMLDEESTKRMQDKTMSGAENLLNSMEDILQWSKSQMENFKPQPKKVAISSLFEDTKNHFSSEEKVRISFENKDNVEINTDENYLKTIIRNLTGNAIKAISETVIPCEVVGQIIWKAWQENNVSYLSITDNGKGATDDQFKALYDDKEVVGIKSGLGLHLIRDLAKAIDCEISVDSKIGKGTTFVLKLT